MSISKVEVQKIAEEVASKHLNIPTLETHDRDIKDFHEVSVWCLEEALMTMFEYGYQKGELDSLRKQNAKMELELVKLREISEQMSK